MSRKPKPVRLEVPAATFSEFRRTGAEALSMFSAETIHAELNALARALNLPAKAATPDIENDEWTEVIESLLQCAGASPPETDTEGLRDLLGNDRWLRGLAEQVQRALRAVDYAGRTEDSGGASTGLLLPTSYARRLEVLLGRGELPVAWVRRIDVLKF